MVFKMASSGDFQLAILVHEQYWYLPALIFLSLLFRFPCFFGRMEFPCLFELFFVLAQGL